MSAPADIQIKKLEIQPFGTNCYILACASSGEGVIIDAPGEAPRILTEARATKVRYIIITHAHPDHIGALKQVRAATGAPVGIHPLEAAMLPSPPDFDLQDGDYLDFGKVRLTVLHTPGHSPGGICLLAGQHLFSGDTLFSGGPGKTQTPDDFKRIISSLVEKVFPLPDQTVVHPGHGADTILGKEKQEFAIFSCRPHPPHLCGHVAWLSSPPMP